MRKILIANRGEIACRVVRTARRMGIETVAVYSDADAGALHMREADQAVHIGPSAAKESYLAIDKILDAAQRTGADAIHPGYGFLSENATFADACAAAHVTFIGPPAAAIRAMGLKDQAKKLMKLAGVPVVPGYQGDDQSLDRLTRAAGMIGYPVLIKAIAGGGGKGMRRVEEAAHFARELAACQGEAARAFGNDQVLLEKYVAAPRHVEVQVFADTQGHVVHLFERDCSVQRRHQKLIEEAPAPGLPEAMRIAMGEAACQAARAIHYVGAGTVEFIVDTSADDYKFFFMEMNTRLQVEHPVTELITGLDLVEWQIRVARGEPLPLAQEQIAQSGHAVEVRLCAEDADAGFLPSTGTLRRLTLPAHMTGVRVDVGVAEHSDITPWYDSMIGKVIAYGPDRSSAISKLIAALDETVVEGVKTNRAFLARVLATRAFRDGHITTGFIEHQAANLHPSEDLPPRILALAALAAITRHAEQARPSIDPWEALGGWRLNLPETRHVSLALSGQVVQQLTLVRQGRGYRFEGLSTPLSGHGQWRDTLIFEVDFEGQILRAAVIVADTSVEVRAWGQTFHFIRADRLTGSTETATASGQITAPMPGRILAVEARAGQMVTAGDLLLTMEAMKMEMRVTAKGNGTVDSVHVTSGAQVSEGQLLVEIVLADG